MIDKLAKIPLLYQPGKGWLYSISMDIRATSSRSSPASRCPTSCATTSSRRSA
jgi:hypothetical protein